MKKFKKTIDPYAGVLLVVPQSVKSAWLALAEADGVSIHEWALRRLPTHTPTRAGG